MYLSVFGLGCLVCCSVGNNGFHSRCQVAKWQSRRNRGTGGYLPLLPEFVRNRIKNFSFKIPWITISPTPRIFRPSYGSGWYLVCSSFRFSFEMNEIGILPGREKKIPRQPLWALATREVTFCGGIRPRNSFEI